MKDDSDLQNVLYEQSVKWYKRGSEAGNEDAKEWLKNNKEMAVF